MTLQEILSKNPNNSKRWTELKNKYNSMRIVPFVGAGMSSPIYPLWGHSLKEILNPIENEEEELDDLINNSNYEAAGQYVWDKKNNSFFESIKKVFCEDKLESNNKKSNSIWLSQVFNGPIITTNFDHTLEHYYNNDFKYIYLLSNEKKLANIITKAVRDNEHILYKLHGDMDAEESLIFAEKQYEDLYTYKEYVDSFKEMCKGMNLLFLGCSLSDNDRYVRILKNVIKEENDKNDYSIVNYAFLPIPDENETEGSLQETMEKRDRELSSAGIFPIWYPCTKNHEAIKVLLLSLKDEEERKDDIEGDCTNNKYHFHIFNSKSSIEDLFVDGCFETYHYLELEAEEIRPVQLCEIVEMVKNNRVLVVEGKYGSGKTVLCKRIQIELRKDKENTLFFNVEDFIKEKTIEKIKNINQKTIIFVDGIDKLVDFELDYKDVEKLCEILKTIIEKNEKLSFVVNSREYYKINSKEGNEEAEKLSSLLAFHFHGYVDSVNVINTKGFYKKILYENFFSSLNPNPDKFSSLNATIIKEWNKKSTESCSIPLFAYVFGQYYYHQMEEFKKGIIEYKDVLPRNKMIIYEKFIQNTINGRFKKENYNGTINKDFLYNYEKILKKTAIHMIHHMRKKIDYSEDASSSGELKNEEIYAISIKTFDEEVKNELGYLYENCNNQSLLLSDVINNYFFNLYSKNKEIMVHFSDINVLCCFAASYIYNILSTLFYSIEDERFDEVYLKVLSSMGMVELQPQFMDYLIFKLEEIENKDNLICNIWKIIKKYNSEQNVSPNNVRAMLVLYVIFLKFYNSSYKSDNKQNFFKMFNRLCMTAKALNINGVHKDDFHRFLAERYFMNCSFIDCEFKRLNYKYFNFAGSKIINSKFEQCNIQDNNFQNCKMTNCVFKLCTFRYITENKGDLNAIIEKKVTISNCIINNLKQFSMILSDNSTLIFKQCTISGLYLKKMGNKYSKIIFENCSMNDIGIYDCTKIVINIKDCVIQGGINIDDHSEVYSDDKTYFKDMKKIKSLENLKIE